MVAGRVSRIGEKRTRPKSILFALVALGHRSTIQRFSADVQWIRNASAIAQLTAILRRVISVRVKPDRGFQSSERLQWSLPLTECRANTAREIERERDRTKERERERSQAGGRTQYCHVRSLKGMAQIYNIPSPLIPVSLWCLVCLCGYGYLWFSSSSTCPPFLGNLAFYSPIWTRGVKHSWLRNYAPLLLVRTFIGGWQ